MKAAPRTIFFNLKPSFNVPVYDIGILSHDDIEAKSSKVCFSSRSKCFTGETDIETRTDI